MTEAVILEVILKEAVWIKQPYLGQKGRPLVILRSQFCLTCVRMYLIGWAQGHRMKLSSSAWTSEAPERRYDWLCELS